MKKTLFHATCSVAISLTFFMGLYSIAKDNPVFWVALIGMNLAVWSSWPRYRSVFAGVASATLTLVVLANPVVSLLFEALSPRVEETPRMAANTALRIDMVDGALPGLSGIRRFSVDGHGFRTNGPIDYGHKPAGVVRIVGIGASTMEEGFIDDSRTWINVVAEQLGRSLGRKVEMINTAYSGLRAEHNFRTLVESEAYAPDIAIFLMGINDWNHAIIERFKSAYPPRPPGLLAPLGILSVDRTLLYRGLELAQAATISLLYRWGVDPPAMEESGAEMKGQLDSLARPVKVGFRPPAVSEEYAGWVGKIMAECHRTRIQCIFLDQPTAYHEGITPDLRRRLWMTPLKAPYTLPFEDISYVAKLYNDWLGATAKEQGFRFCPISPRIPPTTDYFFDDCHYNDNGSRAVARAVIDCLADLGP